MADTVQRGRDIKPQLSPKDMIGSDAAKIGTMAINDELMLGTIIGEARGLSFRRNPQDETKPSVALTGAFKFIPFSSTRNEQWSNRAFLPNTVHDTIVAAFQGDMKSPIDRSPTAKEKPIDVVMSATMKIVLEVGVVKIADTGITYKYITRGNTKVPLVLNDPLAELTATAGLGGDVKQLAAPEKPAAAKKASKRK